MKPAKWLFIIFCLSLSIRLYFSLSTPHFTDGTSYFHLRQVENILETGLPLYEDPLSYSGRLYIFLPFYHYLLAFFGLFFPIEQIAIVLSAAFMSSLVFVGYLIAKKITGDVSASLITSLILGFLPITFTTVNILDKLDFLLPLTFLLLYLFMNVSERKNVYIFLVGLLVMTLTDTSVIMFVFSLYIYLFLVWIHRMKVLRTEIELILFSTFAVVWISFILFKNAFLAFGPSIILQGVPPFIDSGFTGSTLLGLIYQLGVMPVIAGSYVMYKNLFVEEDRNFYILIAFTFSFLILFLDLIPADMGLIYFSVVLAISFAPFYKIISQYLQKIKFKWLKPALGSVFLLLLIFTSYIPSWSNAMQSAEQAYSPEEMEAFKWLKNTPPDSVILTTPDEGHLVTYMGRKNVVDDNYPFGQEVENKLRDVQSIYTTMFETEALRLLNENRVDYIMFSQRAVSKYNVNSLPYTNDENCFKLVYDGTTKIFEVKCTLREER